MSANLEHEECNGRCAKKIPLAGVLSSIDLSVRSLVALPRSLSAIYPSTVPRPLSLSLCAWRFVAWVLLLLGFGLHSRDSSQFQTK